MDMPLPYAVPEIQDNPEGWGPCSVPEHLKDVPFAPFSKGDKLGKAADWTQQAYQKNFPGTSPSCLAASLDKAAAKALYLDQGQLSAHSTKLSRCMCCCFRVQAAIRRTQQTQCSSSSTTRRCAC